MFTHSFSWLVIFLGGLGTMAFGLNRVWVLWLRPAFRFVRRVWSVLDRFSDTAPVMMSMAEQFRNNGGSTLKDAIDKHTKTLASQDDSLAELKAGQERIEKKCDDAIAQRRP